MTEEHRINIMEDAPVASEENTAQEPQLASVPERFIALLIDFGLVSILYQGFLWVLFHMIEPDLETIYALLVAMIVPFVLYETVWNCAGRSTLGKKLVGIQVVQKDTGEPLGCVRSFLRAVGYIPSTLLLMCGFLLAFIDDKRRSLHDYLAGSVVVQARAKSWLEKTALTVIGFILLAAFVGTFYKGMFSGGSWAQQRLVYRAEKHLEKIGYLETLHLIHFGYYTNDLLRLSLLSGDPVQFQRDTHKVLENKGFRIGVGGPKGYKITARAKDAKKTRVTYPKD